MPVLQKGLLWPQSPTCVRRYLQPAYSTELTSNTQSSERGRGKREKKGSKNMKISSEDWEAASAPAILVQIQHTLMNTNTHAYAQTLLASVSGRDQVEINHRAWLSPTGCPHSATLQRGNITSLR